ncbi:hypothetical protein ILUMI_08616 [Ignelater luminosus]|uniref:Uncharacterized protein n=1 Tax=Ignelater luminosus TaxID=2038154 RepID=A0A8K0D5X8_IGNLU|nr:hypothetical protein ILUMI_08616 [Ignelater luminosus]
MEERLFGLTMLECKHLAFQSTELKQTKNLEVINYARDNGAILLCYPPHCTHRLQALDVAFMKPLSGYYEDELSTMLTAIKVKTKIWPVDINVFTGADFLPSTTTDIQTIKVQHISEKTEAISVNPKIKETTPEPESELSFDNSKPGPSHDHETSFKFVSPNFQFHNSSSQDK